MGYLTLGFVLALLQPAVSQETISKSHGQFNPIKKVVTLIEEMRDNVEKEGEEDAAAYEKFKCWCTTNDKEKTAAIANGEAQIDDLTSMIEEGLAKEGQLKTEIETLEREIAEDKEALASATKIREEEHAAFLAEEADMSETATLLKEAIDILSKVQFLQKGVDKGASRRASTVLLQVKDFVSRSPKFQRVMQKDLFDVLDSLQQISAGKHRESSSLSSSNMATGAFLGEVFLPKREATALEQGGLLPWEKTEEQIGKESKPNDLVGAAAGAKSYNSRSGQVLGMLSEMHDEFKRQLAAAQEEENKAADTFKKLNAAKLAEIASATEQKELKEKQLADLISKIAKAKEDIAALKEAVASDKEFLAHLKKTCKQEDEEFAARTKARHDEILAISEALKILTADDARALFSSTISFVQVSSTRHTMSERSMAQDHATEHAMQRIAKVARQHKSWALASLAVRMRLDSFTKVREAMDKMLAELKKQQQEEYEKGDLCKKNIDESEDAIKVNVQTKEDLDEKHTDLINTIDTLEKGIADVHAEIKNSLEELKKAGENRRDENQLYVKSVTDQRLTIEILHKANDRLKQFYQPQPKAADAKLVQVQTHQEPGAYVPPPPPKPSHYNKYDKSEGSGGVIQLLTKIITDAEVTEEQLVQSEQKAQTDYTAFVEDTRASVEAARNLIEEKEVQKASAKADKAETEEAQLANNEELASNADLLKGYHVDCDYVLKYFDIRQKARQEEMDAINEAKAILAGANFGEKKEEVATGL